MKFSLTNEQRSIQRAVYEFTKGEFDDDNILELLQETRFPEKIWKKACKLGFVGICYPEIFGGQECSALDQILVIEELCRKDSSVGIALSFADMGSELICSLGSTEQKKKYLPRLSKGKLMSTALLADTDLNESCRAINLTLTADGDDFRLNGKVDFVFNADKAGLFVVQSCMGDDACFVVMEKKDSGMLITPMGGKLGMGLLSWQEVTFKNVKVEKKDIITTDSKAALSACLQQRLLKISAMYLGIAQGAYDHALTYSKQREQFRRKIAEFQGIRHKLADMYRQVNSARSMVYHAGSMVDQNEIDIADLTVVKLQAEQAVLEVSYEALQIFGGSGYMVEIPIEHYYRDARMLQSLTGRSIFQKDRIAQFIIGNIKN